MSEVYEQYRGFNIFVEQDEAASDYGPRDWDNLGTMVCWHHSYILGDTGGNPKHRESRGLGRDEFPAFLTPDDFTEWMEHKDTVIRPLYLYDHGGIGMSTDNSRYPFNCRWDAGQVGWIYVLHWQIAKEYGNASDENIAKARRCLLAEVEVYNQFISGQVYGYIVKDHSGEHLDSCWGYYGYDHKASGLLEAAHSYVDWHLAAAYKDRARQVMAWIREGVPHIYRTPMRI